LIATLLLPPPFATSFLHGRSRKTDWVEVYTLPSKNAFTSAHIRKQTPWKRFL
jgi:hypothetical protein